jgi:hypothetical protein
VRGKVPAIGKQIRGDIEYTHHHGKGPANRSRSTG